ncbi:MAG TPA: S8 family serine peptidase [Candidatus Xenobia bacterium]|nr:S8 family serine peptidase [Candidatus Xenobia bacterium]
MVAQQTDQPLVADPSDTQNVVKRFIQLPNGKKLQIEKSFQAGNSYLKYFDEYGNELTPQQAAELQKPVRPRLSQKLAQLAEKRPNELVLVHISLKNPPVYELKEELRRRFSSRFEQLHAELGGLEEGTSEWHYALAGINNLRTEYVRELARRLKEATAPSKMQAKAAIGRLGGKVEQEIAFPNGLIASMPAGAFAELLRDPGSPIEIIDEPTLLASQLSSTVPTIRVGSNRSTGCDPPTNPDCVDNAPSFWNNAITGQGYNVGILDSGMDTSSPQLLDQVFESVGGHPALENAFFVNHIEFGFSTHLALCEVSEFPLSSGDRHSHGTHVGSVIMSRGSSDDRQDCSNCIGAAPGVGVTFNLKVACLDPRSPLGASASQAGAHEAVRWAMTQQLLANPPVVFNFSYSGQDTFDFLSQQADYRLSDEEWDRQLDLYPMQVAFGAGNNPPTPVVESPGKAYNGVTVSAISDNDTTDRTDDYVCRADIEDCYTFESAKGPTPSGRKKPDLSAPGVLILVPNLDWESDLDFVPRSGTSLAAPHVAGGAILAWSSVQARVGVLDAPLGVKALLINSAEYHADGAPRWDPEWGWGYLNLAQAYQDRSGVFAGGLAAANNFRLYRGSTQGNTGKATVVWNYHPDLGHLVNLDLLAYDESDDQLLNHQDCFDTTEMSNSCSNRNNVEQIVQPEIQSVVVKVKAHPETFGNLPEERYALAAPAGFQEAIPPNFELFFSHSPVLSGRDFDFTVTVQNFGTVTSRDNKVQLVLPAGFSLVSPASLVQTIPAIGPNTQASVTWRLKAPTINATTSYMLSARNVAFSYGEVFQSGTLSTSVTVSTDTVPPSVAISSPSPGSTVSGTITVSATASDNVGVVGVQFKLDGANLGGEDSSAPYSISWNTTLSSNGSHTLTAVARDGAGSTSTAGGVSVTVSNGSTGSPPPNDDFVNALLIPAPEVSDFQITTGATREASDPQPQGSGCPVLSNLLQRTVWYRYTAPAGGIVVADTFGSNYDTVLSAWTGSPGSFQLIKCNDDDSGGLQSRISFGVQEGATYSLMIGALDPPGTGGALVLSFQGTYPDPILSSISPTTKMAGEPGFVLHVFGSNFFPQSKVVWNGIEEKPTAFRSATELEALISSEDLTAPGSASIRVLNPPDKLSGNRDLAIVAPPDATPPNIFAVTTSGISSTTALVTWQTDEPSTTQVEYGTTTAYGSSSPLDSSLTTSHAVMLSNLLAHTLYHYRVGSRDATGNQTTSDDFVLETTNDPPVATNNSYGPVPEDSGISAGVLGNDSDPNGDQLVAVLVEGPSHGTLTLNANGSFQYVPTTNFNGTDIFTYRVHDGLAFSNVATVSLIFEPVNDAPWVSGPGAQFVNEGELLTFLVFATDDDGDTLMVLVEGVPSGASFVPEPMPPVSCPTASPCITYRFSWTPGFDQAGDYAVVFTASDGVLSGSQPFYISVADVNTVPGANVVVTPVDTTTGSTPVSVTFSNVTQAGITSLTTGGFGAAPPPNFVVGNPPVYYDLSTTAMFTPPITVCINYAGTSFLNESLIRLFHFEGGNWVDGTTSLDTNANVVCGVFNSLSPFGLFEPIAPLINANGAVNAASFAPGGAVVPGSIAAVFGSNLATDIAFGGALPLPTTLAGATLLFNGSQAVPKFFASPFQINAQIPWELAGQMQATLTDTVGPITSPGEVVLLAPFSPGLFATNSQGTGQGAILIANTPNLAAPAGMFPGSRPAVRGVDFLEIYWTGGGAVTNQPSTGAAASANPLSQTTATPTVTIGGVPATVLFSGLAPGFVGLYVVTLQVPAGAPTGAAVPVVLTIGGIQSNTVTIAVE